MKDFLNSLVNLTRAGYDAGVDIAYGNFPDFGELLDIAQRAGDVAASKDNLLWEQKRVAEIDVREAAKEVARSLGWNKSEQWNLAVAAGRAAGSILVFDYAPHDKLEPAFYFFRFTAARLPFDWAPIRMLPQ